MPNLVEDDTVADDVTVPDLVEDNDAAVTVRVTAVETLTVVVEVRYDEFAAWVDEQNRRF